MVKLIPVALATFRITRLVTTEEGPFGLAQKLRDVADPDQKTWLGRGLNCPWCVSFWVGPVVFCAASYETGRIIVGGLATSALVGLGYQCGGLLLSYAERLLRRR